MHTPYTAVIGASVNAEQSFEFNSEAQNGAKKEITDLTVGFSGSSGNVGTAIKSLGGTPLVVGLVGVELTLEDILLHEAVNQSGIDFRGVPVLHRTNFGINPIDHGGVNPFVFGRRGKILEHMVEGAIQELRSIEVPSSAFVVVTGLRPVERFYALEMMRKATEGRRIVNFKDTFGGPESLREILEVSDMVIINRQELQENRLMLENVHFFGPEVVIVTEDKDGGEYSIRGKVGRFEAVEYEGAFKSATGAGDWFTGAVVQWMTSNNHTALSLEPETLEECLHFSAKAAGKKITMPGGFRGPVLSEL